MATTAFKNIVGFSGSAYKVVLRGIHYASGTTGVITGSVGDGFLTKLGTSVYQLDWSSHLEVNDPGGQVIEMSADIMIPSGSTNGQKVATDRSFSASQGKATWNIRRAPYHPLFTGSQHNEISLQHGDVVFTQITLLFTSGTIDILDR